MAPAASAITVFAVAMASTCSCYKSLIGSTDPAATQATALPHPCLAANEAGNQPLRNLGWLPKNSSDQSCGDELANQEVPTTTCSGRYLMISAILSKKQKIERVAAEVLLPNSGGVATRAALRAVVAMGEAKVNCGAGGAERGDCGRVHLPAESPALAVQEDRDRGDGGIGDRLEGTRQMSDKVPLPTAGQYAIEGESGARFKFGENWARFLTVLDEDRISEAQRSLVRMLGLQRLDGMTFLDVGSGSGLFSLVAYRLGAIVRSFDYDPQSVAATAEMRRRYCTNTDSWRVEEASVLDADYLAGLGQFDVVYAWGVLHHTGAMWKAMENVVRLVAPGGRLFIALYNDQNLVSDFWRKVKRLYCSGRLGRLAVITVFFPVFAIAGLVEDLLRWKNPLCRYTEYRRARGMSLTHDWIDWLGGYPYETAKPGDVFEFFFEQGFTLTKLVTRPSIGCNEFVFCHAPPPGPSPETGTASRVPFSEIQRQA